MFQPFAKRIQLSPSFKIKSMTQNNQDFQNRQELYDVQSDRKNKKYKLLLKSISAKKSVTIDNVNQYSIKKSQSLQNKKPNIPKKLVNIQKKFLKKRKKSILRDLFIQKQKKVQNLFLLQKLLTIQPTNVLKKQYLDKSYNKHIAYKQRVSKLAKNNSFIPGYLPKIKRSNTNSKTQQYRTQV